MTINLGTRASRPFFDDALSSRLRAGRTRSPGDREVTYDW